MPLFVAIGLDYPPHSMEKRDASRAGHRSYVVENDQRIVMTGPFLDDANNQCGSFYIFDVDSEQDIHEWLKNEPFYQTGVYRDLIIRRFEPGLNRLETGEWGANPKVVAALKP